MLGGVHPATSSSEDAASSRRSSQPGKREFCRVYYLRRMCFARIDGFKTLPDKSGAHPDHKMLPSQLNGEAHLPCQSLRRA